MIEIKHKSALPIYIAGLIWIIYSCIFPMYKLIHIIIALVLCIAAYIVAGIKIPDRIEMVEEKIRYTGAKDVDLVISEGNRYVKELKDVNDRIADEVISAKIDRLTETSKKIFSYIAANPGKVKDIRRYMTYFLPTTLKLLNTYSRASVETEGGENIKEIKANIEGTIDSIITAFQKYLDNLYADEAMDVDAEITVFESMLNAENLKKQKG
ncbi:MAG: 5-bromo-4-chloroindolyl phosphate hydrolysis family protein [Clostridia bacterium]